MSTDLSFVLNTDSKTTYSNKSFETPPCELFLSVEQLISPVMPNKGTSKRIPRPLNSFMIFRRNFNAGIVAVGDSKRDRNFVAKVSSQASKAWGKASPRVKKFFSVLAEEAKLGHQRLFPEYQYSPKKKKPPSSLFNKTNKA
ncbi:1677_t:CDS:1 [Ambispora leptoticha]|uniref:1677_t:CDS:1 n=1 Tax=Ambispora leptoticha TaxID=144679 RepID=A0A9N8YRK0_9GLOM|nr:1677_t:CDS:1 [Ambispora leptoticha]